MSGKCEHDPSVADNSLNPSRHTGGINGFRVFAFTDGSYHSTMHERDPVHPTAENNSERRQIINSKVCKLTGQSTEIGLIFRNRQEHDLDHGVGPLYLQQARASGANDGQT